MASVSPIPMWWATDFLIAGGSEVAAVLRTLSDQVGAEDDLDAGRSVAPTVATPGYTTSALLRMLSGVKPMTVVRHQSRLGGAEIEDGGVGDVDQHRFPLLPDGRLGRLQLVDVAERAARGRITDDLPEPDRTSDQMSANGDVPPRAMKVSTALSITGSGTLPSDRI